MNVLFVGNSYVYFNDLPGLLRSLGDAGGVTFAVESVAEGGMTLLGHLNHGPAVERIRAGDWDAVVLQEQSGRPIWAPAAMHAAARRLDAEISGIGARTVLYLTWAQRGQGDHQAALDAAYYGVARALGATVAPVGPAWRRALAERPDLLLHRADGSHPAPTGTYLAACVYFAVLTGRCPVGLPLRTVQAGEGGESSPVDLADEEVAFLQRVAWDTVKAGRAPARRCRQEQAQASFATDFEVDLDVELLREAPIVRGLSDQQLHTFLAAVSRRDVSAGSVLFAAGDTGGRAYIVLDGEFGLATDEGETARFAPGRLGQALTVGMEGLKGEPYAATVTTVKDTAVLEVGIADLENLAIREPALAETMRRNLRSR